MLCITCAQYNVIACLKVPSDKYLGLSLTDEQLATMRKASDWPTTRRRILALYCRIYR